MAAREQDLARPAYEHEAWDEIVEKELTEARALDTFTGELRPAPAGWEIDDDLKAEWALNKMAQEAGDIDRQVMICKTIISRYTDELARLQNKKERKLGHLRDKLARYFETVPHRATKTQQIYDLPSGRLVSKDPGPGYEVDDAKLVEYLKKNAFTDYIKVVEGPKWGDFKKVCKIHRGKDGLPVLVDQDGNVVSGVKVEDREPQFTVEF